MNQFFLGIELTRHCNLRCAHCFRADLDQVGEISFDVVEKILREAEGYLRPHIALTGGEPTLHSRFREILNLIIARGYTFHFVTNGYNYDRLFQELYPLFGHKQWIGVSFSLDGATPETHNAIRGPHSFARVLAAIAVAKTHKLEVVVQMVVHRGNRRELEAMALLCSKMGADRLHIAHMQPTPHAVQHGLLHSPEECRDVERDVGMLQSQFRIPIVLSAGFYDETPIGHCRFLKHGALNIDFQGRLTTCCQLSNMEESDGEADVVADLARVSLAEAHQKLLAVYNGIHTARLQQIQNGSFHKLDNFHCWSCMKHFRKVEWMKNHAENEWVQSDPYFRKETM